MARNQRDESNTIQNDITAPASSGAWEANGSQTITISNVGPAGVGTATISKWLKITDPDTGINYFLPAWT